MDNPKSDAPNEGPALPRIPKKKKFAAGDASASASSTTSRASHGGDGGNEGEEGKLKGAGDDAPGKGGGPPKKKVAVKRSSAEQYDPPILRKGDLVRLSNEQKSGRIQGGLARVTRAHYASCDDDEPLSYDIEYVLGGKLAGLDRSDLEHTTAAAEGLVDTNRRRRSTATSATQQEQEAELKAKAKKRSGKGSPKKARSPADDSPSRRGPGRPPGSKNRATLEREAGKAKSAKEAKKKRPAKSDASTAASSKSKKRRGSTKSSDAESLSAAEVRSQAAKIGHQRRREREAAAKKAGLPKPAPKTATRRRSAADASESDAASAAEAETAADRKSKRMDVYTKHRKELERSLGRLEKADRFGFFLDVTPPEYDEEYDDGDEEMDAGADEGEVQAENVRRKKKAVHFPDQPPFNFHVVKKRFAAGRYDLDMVALEQRRLREIKAMVGASASSGDEANEADDVHYDELAKSMTHPIAVDWETFNKDILAMCDAATERDPEGAELGSGHLGWAALKVQQLMKEMYEIYGAKRRLEVDESEAKAKYMKVLASCGNMEAAVQGIWRKEAFPERKYERLEKSSVICDGLSPKDRSYAMYELETKLPDSFVGLAYTYDDSGQHSETWMKTVADETTKRPKKKKKKEGDDSTESSSLTSKSESKAQRAALALARDDGVVRAQVQTTMTTLLIQVQDKVMTDLGVMNRPEARSANWDDGDRARDYRGDATAEVEQGTHSGFSLPEVAEQEVWGIDCYTRKNVMTLIENEFNAEIATEFVQKWLLPAINACPVNLAHKMSTASRLLEGLPLVAPESDSRRKRPSLDDATSGADESDAGANPLSNQQPEASNSKPLQESSVFLRTALETKIKEHGPPWLKAAARLIRLASDSLDDDHFRIHPKGHGSVVIGEGGLKANSLVTYYRGEVYPAWRWCEKLDAIEHVQRELDLRPNLPDFYNMAMERPTKDPRGYSLLFVDASRKSGLGSSFSHSCNPSCEVRVVSLGGKLSLAMTTLRDLEEGEELTFDYNAVTESLNEYRFAVCLCGQARCRGSFLHFATADCYQQVLSRNSPPSARFANLVRGCMKQVMSKEDSELLLKHGFNTAAFGAVSFNHHVSNVGPQSTPDSIENVPIWLRTFVADCLRYIEYERRALPVALLCNQMERMEKKQGKKKRAPKKMKAEPANEAPSEKSKAVAGSKPQTSYFFFLQSQRDRWEKLMLKQPGGPELKGLERSQATNKQASQAWSNLGEDEKQKWKKKAIADWKKKGGKAKAKLEEERLRALKNAPKVPAQALVNQSVEDAGSEQSKTPDHLVDVETKTISFADADAEGFSAMEQRIQQLAQSLSRVGRVLDRHRESVFAERTNTSATADSDLLRSLIHSPLKIMSDEDVVNWMWSDPRGIVRNLFAMVERHFPENSLLTELLSSTKKGYPVLTAFTQNYTAPNSLEKKWKHSCTGSDARRLARDALLKFRANIIAFLNLAERSITEARNEKRREQARAREEKKKHKANSEGGESMADDQFSPLHEHETSADHVSSFDEQAMLMRGGGDESVPTDPPIVSSQELPSTGASVQVNSDTLLPPTAEPNGSQHEATKTAESSVHQDVKPSLPPTSGAKDSLHEDVKSLLQFSQIASGFRAIPEAPPSGHVSAETIPSRPTLSVDTSETQASEANQPPTKLQASEANPSSPKLQVGDSNQSPSKLQELIEAASGEAASSDNQGGLSPPAAPLSTGSQDPASAGSEPKKPKKKVVPLSDDQVRYLKDWMFDPRHILNPYPTDDEKTVMEKTLGIERKRLDGWFMKNRQRVLSPDIQPVDMKWRKRDQDHWVEFRKSRYMLEATADLLLMYANTNTFFQLEPFREFATTEVEVYARELGNNVPRHFALNSQKSASPAPEAVDSDGDAVMNEKEKASTKGTEKEGASELCSPDDVIDKVVVDYSGEYVLSQLLQWVNGGIGQRKGLPDVYGCVMLPPIEGCWEEVKCSEVKLPNYTKWNKKTTTEYDGTARPKLAEWISDRYQRGSPWDDEVKKFLCPQGQVVPDPTLPMGSPVIDYLVTGFDDNVQRVASALQSGRSDENAGGRKRLSAKDRLQSTVDEGMPAQAVANWVQCEDPKCLKWRKLPWHVDVDLLPEKFFCRDNIWNPKSSSCEAEEDEWDMDDAPIKFTNAEQFVVDAWFDVQREGKVGYHEAQVVELDFESNVKRVKFHFHRLSSDRDEWIEVGSPRIAPHHAYTPRPRDGYVEPKKKQGSTPSDALPQKRKIGTFESSASGAGGATSGPKKSIPFPQATIEYLTAWMNQHANNPFPDSDQKARIIADTGLNKRQLSDWMARYRKKMRQKSDKPATDLQTMSSISSSPTKMENLLLELRNQPPKGSAGLVASSAVPPAPLIKADSDKPQTSIRELEAYMKTWLTKPENQCNFMPSAVQKEQIVRETGIEKKRLEGWFFRARKRAEKEKERDKNPSRLSPLPPNAGYVAAGLSSGPTSAMQHPSLSNPSSLSAPHAGMSISPMIPKKASAPVPPTNAGAPMSYAGIAKPAPASVPVSGVANVAKQSSTGLTDEAKRHLSLWMMEHAHNPYPTRKEKDAMMKTLGVVDERKLEGWFCRARKRLKERKAEANRQNATISHASTNMSNGYTLHPGHRATAHNAANQTHQSSAPAQSSVPAQAASSPFASLMSAVTSELTPQRQAETASSTHQSQGFAPSSGDSASKFRNLGEREQAILESFQALTQGSHRAAPVEQASSHQQYYGHQQDSSYYSQSHPHPQGHQTTDYSAYEYHQRQQQAQTDYARSQGPSSDDVNAAKQAEALARYYQNMQGHQGQR